MLGHLPRFQFLCTMLGHLPRYHYFYGPPGGRAVGRETVFWTALLRNIGYSPALTVRSARKDGAVLGLQTIKRPREAFKGLT